MGRRSSPFDPRLDFESTAYNGGIPGLQASNSPCEGVSVFDFAGPAFDLRVVSKVNDSRSGHQEILYKPSDVGVGVMIAHELSVIGKVCFHSIEECKQLSFRIENFF